MLRRLLTKKIWLSAVIAFVAIAAIVGLLLRPKPQPDVTATVEPTKVITLEPSATPKPVAALEARTEYGFEDGTTQGWGPRGEAAVSVATDMAHSGSYSLLTTDRKAEWQGATMNVAGVLEAGSMYEIGAYVRLAEGEPASRVIITMQRTPMGGETKYEWIAPSAEKGVTDAEWVYLQGQYSYSGEVSELLLYVESPDAALVDFYVDDITITRLSGSPSGPPVQTDIPSVYETLSPYFVVGAAIEPDQLDQEQHNILLTRHFNSITAENAMKPGSIQPSEGEFRWTGPDKLVQYARDNDMAIHGHTLVWHQQAAEWMFEDSEGNPLAATPENKELVLQRLETHIRAVVGRYKDDVQVWDVVNEVIDPGNSDCMRRSRWYELTGTDYIVTAFRVADEVAPDAVLLINDYSTTEPQKRTCLYDVVSDLQAQGVPIDGVGHQMHISIASPSAEVIEETILMFAELGVEQHITELDMSIYANDIDSYTTVPDEILVRQGKRYKAVFDAFKRQADHIQSVTFWGLADDHTWLKTFPVARINLPLLFDERLQAKPAYWGVVDPTKLP
jgi:endo-1,4-beta-xylanase